MRRIVRALAVTALLSLTCTLAAPTAEAAYGDRITRLDFQVDVRPDGTLAVTETLDLAFASQGHGPYVAFVTRMPLDAADPRAQDWERRLDYDIDKVTSPTGAPTDTVTEDESSTLLLRIGDEDRYVSGTQTYVLTYTLSGALNGAAQTTTGDELYWNIVGTGWTLPIDQVSVTISSPADVVQTQCWTAPATPCDHNSNTSTSATFTQANISPGQGLTIAVGWPALTYPGIEPILVTRNPLKFALSPALVPLLIGGLLSVAALAAVVVLRRRGRDERYAGIAPGSLPAQGETLPIVREEVTDAPVQFGPPAGLPPAQVGALVRERAAMADVTATVVDMAVRGFYRFVQEDKAKSFSLERQPGDPVPTLPFELRLYNKIFSGSANRVSRKQLERRHFGTTMLETQQRIGKDLVRQKWYRRSPEAVVGTWVVLGGLIAAAGLAAGIGLGLWLGLSGHRGWLYAALPLVVLGGGFIAIARSMPIRTPVGSALASQGFGFKKYLETAEADQIRWEEGEDIFSRYLPYAIVFDCADRWAKVFEDLAARGAAVPLPQWYVGPYGYGYGFHSWESINSSIGQLSSVSVSGLPSSSGGASGHSAFSGGGGFGGGVGGGGGGSW
jgi:hypothetical protein